jgi:hypothetical protein
MGHYFAIYENAQKGARLPEIFTARSHKNNPVQSAERRKRTVRIAGRRNNPGLKSECACKTRRKFCQFILRGIARRNRKNPRPQNSW